MRVVLLHSDGGGCETGTAGPCGIRSCPTRKKRRGSEDGVEIWNAFITALVEQTEEKEEKDEKEE